MPNRHYSPFKESKVKDTKTQNTDTSAKGPSNYSGYKAESTASWPGAAGPKGRKLNANPGMFHEVKQSAKQDMNDDLYGRDPAILGLPLGESGGIPPMPGLGGIAPMPVPSLMSNPGMVPPPMPVPGLLGGPGMGAPPTLGIPGMLPKPMPLPGLRIGGGRRRRGGDRNIG